MPSTSADVIDGISTSTAVKAPVRGIVTANVSLSGLSTVTTLTGSVTPTDGDRFLLTAQTDAAENLIYEARSGAWTLAPDSDGARDLRCGSLVVTQGGLSFGLDTADPIEPGTTELEWSTRFSVMLSAFGASPSSLDNTAAINAAFDFIRDNQDATLNAVGYSLDFPTGIYVALGSIDATGIRTARNWVVNGNGSVIHSKAAGKIALDLTHSRFLNLRDLTVYGDETDKPSIGIQIGRKDSTAAGGHHFDNVATQGYFSFAGLYNFASEVFLAVNCKFWNDDDSATSYAVVQDGENHHDIASDFQTITAAVDTGQSFTQNTFLNADIRKANGGPALRLSGRSSNHQFINSYAVTADDAAVVIDSSSFGHRDLKLDLHMETEGQLYAIKFISDTGVATTVRGFDLTCGNMHASDSVLKRDASTASVTLREARINPGEYTVTPSVGFLSDSGFSFEGAAMTSHAASAAELRLFGINRFYTRVAIDGSGLWKWDPTDTTTADDGVTVLVDAINRRWKRQPTGALNLSTPNGTATSTIATGTVAKTRSNMRIDTEAAAASDDLDTISGGADGDILILQAASSARTVVVKHGTGNINLNGSADFSLDNVRDKVVLIYNAFVDQWDQIGGGDNGA